MPHLATFPFHFQNVREGQPDRQLVHILNDQESSRADNADGQAGEHRREGGRAARLASLIRIHREGAGLTQLQLATRAGVSVGALRDIEQGRTSAPRPGSLAGLAAALELREREHDDLLSLCAGSREAVGPDWPPCQGASATAGLRLGALGPFVAWRDGAVLPLGPVRQRAVLGLLAMHRSTGLTRRAIIDALWGEHPPLAAVGTLHGYISRLRRLVGAGGRPGDGTPGIQGGCAVTWDGASYRLEADGIGCDVEDFLDLVRDARLAAAEEKPAQACRLYEQALQLWRGEPLADLDLLDGHPAVTELSQRRAAVVIEYADAAQLAGLDTQVLGQLRMLAEREPLDEGVHGRLMVAMAAAGQQAAALGMYEDLRLRLDQELGVRPSPALAEAHVRVLRQEVRPAVAATPWPLDPTPAAARAARMPDRVIPRQLPVPSTHFAGRVAELAMLDGLLDHATPAMGVVTISGGPGVGKTALAVRWAHQIADRFPDGQLYLNLRGYGPGRNPVPATNAIRAFLDALQVPRSRIPADPDGLAGLYRSILATRQLLIVLDNAASADQVRPLLPGSSDSLVVLTSRDRLASLTAAEGAHPVALDLLTHADARQLIAQWLGPARLGSGPVADELIALCARLPLALSVAVARAAEHPTFPLDAIAADLRDPRLRLDALDSEDPAYGARAVFSWSYETLTEPAAALFRLLSIHPGADITALSAATLSKTSVSCARRSLNELARRNLVTEHTPGRFACNDLLRAYAAEQCGPRKN